MSKVLVAFYSRANENYVNGQMKNLKIGNTEIAANEIANLTNADMFKIEQVNPYSDNYNECISQAQDDQRKNARPELKNIPKTLMNTTLFTWDIQIIGVQCLWLYLHFWNTLISAIKL